MVYKCSIMHNGETKTVTGNWAAIMYSIYDAIGEENLKDKATDLGQAQVEMFFEQEFSTVIMDGDNKYKIYIKTVKPTT